MDFEELAKFLRQRGYTENEVKEGLRIFYEFGTMDFLCSDCAKKYEVEYKDGKVTKAVMVQYWFGQTLIREINTMEELRNSL